MSIASLTAPLPPEWYWQPEHLEQERARIFRENWIFAGFADDLKKDNDYLSFTVAGLPVVVRSMKGVLVAFRNVCSHRHSLIHAEGRGNAMFRCLYHGWTYNAAGIPIGIPDNEKSFGFDKDAKCALALESLALDRVGRFLFVRSAKAGPTLKQWLGPLAETLKQISKTFDKIYGRVELNWKCNWKIGLEITLEGYHLPMIHPKSFAEHVSGATENSDPAAGENTGPAIPLPPTKPFDNDTYGHNEYIGPHSLNSAALSEASMVHLTTVRERLQLAHTESKNYDHYLIYPNLMIGVNGGTNVCVERYEPVAADQSKVQCWLMVESPADRKLYEGIIWQTIMKQWQDWTVPVLGEDQVACEATQIGVRFADRQALLGRAEERVRHYQSAIRDQVMPRGLAA